MNTQPIRTLYCTCCGGMMRGRQWHNQDTGHGLCYGCSFIIPARSREPYTVESFERTYGVRGVHIAVTELTTCPAPA